MKVRTTTTFSCPGVHCPALGTIGKVVGTIDNRYKIVRFTLPMLTATGSKILPYDEKDTLDIYFRDDEIELFTP
jgi:hypothetical protein